jgi:hyperosmotically inducible protein
LSAAIFAGNTTASWGGLFAAWTCCGIYDCEQPLLSPAEQTEFNLRKEKKMKVKTLIVALGMLASTLSFSMPNALASEQGLQSSARIEKQVRHELNMLPYVNAFDYLAYSVDENGTVTLTGSVTRPVVKSDAGNVVKRIEGVERVDNQIQVLPVSFFDDGLRIRLFRTIYGYPTLQKYSLGTLKPIRIIVANGRVTLMGVVDNEMDKNVAGIRANSVPGIFAVDNQLKVVKG